MCFFFCFGSASASETPLTIDQIQKSIQTLHDDSKDLEQRIDALQNSDILQDFFKPQLTSEELDNLQQVINEYIVIRNESVSQNELFGAKKELYQSMTLFIDPEKLDEYLAYIEEDIRVIKKKDTLNEELQKHQQLLNTKVDYLEEKIKDHTHTLSEILQSDIEEKIEHKLGVLKNNPKFSVLTPEQKQNVLAKTIRKIKIRISNIESITQKTDILQTKFGIYVTLLEKIEAFQNEIQQD
ncbi:hypothetical protein MK079_04895 [Candidatus Gracilibacteria bacterium]|nr:hypothetical protein [Candidatus Gracilibacteria bacterium]